MATLRALFVPLRFPLHVLQMTGLYVGQMAPSAFITNAAHFSAADEMRRVQRIAYWTKVLANAHGDELATTELARGAWEDDPAWQPLRRACEQLLVTHDWGEAFAARNLAVKPALDALLNSQLAALARRNSDEFLALLFTEFQVDCAAQPGLVVSTRQLRARAPARAARSAQRLAWHVAAPGGRGSRAPRGGIRHGARSDRCRPCDGRGARAAPGISADLWALTREPPGPTAATRLPRRAQVR